MEFETAQPEFVERLRQTLPTLHRLYKNSDFLWSRTPAALSWLCDWRDYHGVFGDEDLFAQLRLVAPKTKEQVEGYRNALAEEALRRLEALGPEIGRERVREETFRMAGEAIRGEIWLLAILNRSSLPSHFRNQVAGAAMLARVPAVPLQGRNQLWIDLGVLAKASAAWKSEEHMESAALAALSGVEIGNLSTHLRFHWPKIPVEDVDQSLQLALWRALRRWSPLKHPAFVPYLAKSTLLDAKKEIRDKLATPPEEISGDLDDILEAEARFLHRESMTALPKGLELVTDPKDRLDGNLRRVGATKAERRAVERKLGNLGPLSPADKMALQRLRQKALDRQLPPGGKT
jgi:hypothetical protein